MKKAIVFGANGYIGRHIVKHLCNEEYHVHGIDINQASKDSIDHYSSLDLTDKKQVSAIDFNVELIYLFAGKTGTLNGFDDAHSFLMANEVSLLHILDAIKDLSKKPTMVFPSTRLVYKGQKDVYLKESDTKEAKTMYAANKIACEYMIEAYANYFDIPYIIARICVPYGNCFDGSYSYGTIGFFLTRALSGNNITLYGNGTVRRTFTHVQDIVKSLQLLTESEVSLNNTYNIGSNDNISLLDAASLIAKKYKVAVDFVPWPESALKIESGDTIFDDTKLKDNIGFQYEFDLTNWIISL